LLRVIEHHPYCSFLQLFGIPLSCVHDSILSKDGASRKPGAIQATGSMMTYRYTITVKKDKPSSWVALEHVSTDIDGEWPPGYPEEPSIGFGGTTLEITEENPDGSTTYQTELWVQKGFTSTHKPYENQRFRYRFHLVKKDQTYVTSSQFCYPELPC
ncbi:MAG: hypothetical protein M1455_03455, partial [Actinobacteria bacterium]|nr:hypothetical protein [Actinomycetota bacterium]